MSAAQRADVLITELEKVLRPVLGIDRAANIREFRDVEGGARYLPRPDVRIAHHFDLKPAFLIFDPACGSLGIVDVVLPAPDDDEKKTRKAVRDSIDRATYARHLLLRDPRLRGHAALTVELVLLTGDETPSERDALVTIGEELRSALRDSDSLFHVGIGVLCYSGGAFKEGSLRRAFPWLLKATREWFGSPHAQPAVTPGNGRSLREIRLSNYRLPGDRHLKLSPTRVHLVHGPNGSGKSSIVEALELVTTGSVERLTRASETKYDGVIKNRGSKDPAAIVLGWTVDGGVRVLDSSRQVIETGISDALAKELPASSFRLDQPLMDRLVGQFPHERARHYLETFFIEARESLTEYGAASDAWQPHAPKLEQVMKTLEGGKQALASLAGWRAAPTTAGRAHEEFPVLLNRWLEQTAALDLVRRERAVRATVKSARATGWQSDDRTVTQAVSALDADRDATAFDGYEKALADSVAKLQQTLEPLTAPAPPSSGSTSAEHVTPTQVQTLNAIGLWLYSTDVFRAEGPFGDAVARVIGSGQVGAYGTLPIGGDKWADLAIQQVDAALNACKTVQGGQDPPRWPLPGECPDYDGAANAQRALLEAAKKVSTQFVDKLRPQPGHSGEYDGSLIAAINEMMALFTPARWAYSDIRLPSTVQDGKVGVNIELGEHERPVRAELHLNTAELNLFTVALFLLCATRIHKPLNALLMDDPLQNMDELTATALARGLAKLIRLWARMGRREEVLLLFHGSGDLERFGAEVPAAKYQLPWLTPSASSSEITIEAVGTAGDVLVVQPIKHLIDVKARPQEPASDTSAL